VSLQVLVKPEAEAGMAQAYRWYEEQRSGLGDDFIDAAETTIKNVADGPERYALVHGPVRRALMRGFPYSVYFQIEGDRVVILTVVHQRRDPKVWREDD
jgi:plasmid stabilization system protein ParE